MISLLLNATSEMINTVQSYNVKIKSRSQLMPSKFITLVSKRLLTLTKIGRNQIYTASPAVHVQRNFFEKTLIEVGSSHIHASFGTFCFQIGQLFEAQ